MDARRRAFLDGIEADLTTTAVSHDAVDHAVTAAHPRQLARKVGTVVVALTAGASFFLLPAAGTATAQVSAAAQQAASNCMVPDHVPWTHTKQCPSVTWVKYWYKYTYSPNGGIVLCYVFDADVNSPCGGGTFERESCQ